MTTILAQAVAALCTERDQVAARLAGLDEAIATLRQIDGVTPDVPAPTRRPTPGGPSGGGRAARAAGDADALLAALRQAGGPVTPREVLQRIFPRRETAGRRAAVRLKVAGALVSTGRGHASKWALRTKSPAAKEAP